ncbi:ATP-binding protein [Collinsella sp. HCP3S3_B8]|uniref:ATP-binding protein n=1 Tax=Collinsella sp. HCP3S3_B8 TaxID=3438933 RepID=UPI003F8C1B3F
MSFGLADDCLLVGEVSEVHGARLKVRVYADANEAHTFFHGEVVRGVSVGGYLKIPCGYDSVIGIIEGDYQQESHVVRETADSRVAPGQTIERFVDVSVFGVMSKGGFDRGISTLPLVKSKAYLLTAEELGSINSPILPDEPIFRVGALAGHDGTSVYLPANALFASHIGVFGNTGSGKSNTLCKIYSDCFERIDHGVGLDNVKNKFVFIDFNGEYIDDGILTDSKSVFELNTRTAGDKVPVPEDFYSDVDIWSILTRATDKTQKPFLSRCISTAKRVRAKKLPGAYLKKMLENLLAGYCGNASSFGEQRSDLARLVAFAIPSSTYQDALEDITAALDCLETRDRGTVIHNTNKGDGDGYLNSPTDVPVVFEDCLALRLDFATLANDVPRLLAFLAYYRYLEQWRRGSITREHISSWIGRYSSELQESRRLFEVRRNGMIEEIKSPIVVFSLLKVNQDQKRVIPLVIAKYLYEEQKKRGQNNLDSSVHLVIDEAHNILSYSSQRESESWRDYRLETFEEIVKEGRKFGMYLTVCSQRPADISPTILSQMHNYFIHRLVNDEDLKAITKSVSFIDGASMSMIPVLPQGCCIVSGTAATHPARVQVERLERKKQPRSYDRALATVWHFCYNKM